MKLKNFKALMRDRKGVAIELAIAVMLITLAVSTILISTAVHTNSHRTSALDDFEKKIAFYQEFEYEVANEEAYAEGDNQNLVEVVRSSNGMSIKVNGNYNVMLDNNDGVIEPDQIQP